MTWTTFCSAGSCSSAAADCAMAGPPIPARRRPCAPLAGGLYLRITYGFGRMPAWEDQFSDHERMAITAYMKSHLFGN